jgi:hypothetical protein
MVRVTNLGILDHTALSIHLLEERVTVFDDPLVQKSFHQLNVKQNTT